MEIEQITVNSSWIDLSTAVYQLKQVQSDRPIWQAMQDKPLTPESIKTLFSNGWKVYTSSLLPSAGECKYYPDGTVIIWLKSSLTPFIRDLTLCHEITHAWYPDPNFKTQSTGIYVNHEDELIVEWKARQLRADPKFLRGLASEFNYSTLHIFDFQPVIYDRASLLAFGLHGYDLDKAQRRCPKPLMSLPMLMDPEADTSVYEEIKNEADYEHYLDLLI